MAAVRTSLVRRRHAWTGEDLPWSIDVADDAVQALPADRRAGWRLFHYLSGGGIRTFPHYTSTARALVSRRQTRFLWTLSLLAVLWLVFRFI